MSDFTTYANAFRTRLQSFAALPLYWPNDERAPTLDVAPNGFVFSEIRVEREEPASLGLAGGRLHRDYGEFAIYVYVPHGSRVGTAEAHAQTIRNLFKMSDVSGVVITNRTIGPGVRSENSVGRFWGVPIIVQFFSDRTE